MNRDPIAEIERMVKEMHDNVSFYTNPVLKKYPLVFAFLVTFGFAAVLNGFDIIIDDVEIIRNHPYYLMLSGIIVLVITGTLYKKFNK